MIEDLLPWDSEPEAANLIAAVIKSEQFKNVIELGVFRGATGLKMIEASETYLGIDIEDKMLHPDYLQVVNTSDKARFIKGNTINLLRTIADNSADLIFIDTVHEYAHLVFEFKECERIIKQNGIIALHDSVLFEGVKKWVDEVRVMPHFDVITFNTPSYKERGPSIGSGITFIKCLYAKNVKAGCKTCGR